MLQSWTWRRFPNFGVAYSWPRSPLPVVLRCRVTRPSLSLFDYLDEKTESLDYDTDPQSPALYSDTVLEEAFDERSSLEEQRKRVPFEIFPKDLPANDEPVRGSRQRRSARLKTEAEEIRRDEAGSSDGMEAESGEEDEDAVEQRTLTELENRVLMKGLEKARLGEASGQNLPLLKQPQEFILGILIQRAVPILKTRRKLQGNRKRKPTKKALAAACGLQPAEMEKILKDGVRAKNIMMQYNVRLVYHCAKLHSDRCPRENLGDLIMEGMGTKGLERAVMGYDPTRGHRFSTYAYPWIRQAMSRCIDNDLTTIRLPQSAKATVAKIKHAIAVLSVKYPPSTSEIEAIAKETDLPVKTVRRCIKLTKTPVSLERTAAISRKGEEIESLAEQVADPNSVDAMEVIRQQCIRDMLDSAMSILEPRERKVLQLRYGLDTENGWPMTRGEVADLFQISNERVRQIEEGAKIRMRKVWKKAFLEADLIKS